jgi:uncharacterized protein with GYD domain
MREPVGAASFVQTAVEVHRRRCVVFTYVGLIKLTPEGRENLEKAPEYLEKIRHIVEEEGGILEQVFAIMGPWDFFAIVKYPDNETAFRVLAKIGLLEVVKTETFPAEPVDVFVKALV